jgi:PAS domain S-box-containing protein
MALNWTPYGLLPLLAGSIALGLTVYAWRHRSAAGTLAFAATTLAASQWSFGYLLEMLSPTLAGKIFWDNAQFLGTVLITPALLIFVLLYTRRTHWLTQPWRWLLIVEPLVTLSLAYTNDWHHLIRINPKLDSAGPFTALTYEYGPWIWFSATYYYGLGLTMIGLLLARLTRSTGLYRRQVGFVLLGAAIPYLGSLITIFGLVPLPVPNLDISPLSFTLGFTLIAWGVYRYHLLDIVPIARDIVIENMVDGMVVLESKGRILDVNPVGVRLLGRTFEQLIGQPLDWALTDWREPMTALLAGAQTKIEASLIRAGIQRDYEVHCLAIPDEHGDTMGRLLTFYDITERKRVETQIRQLNEELENRVLERTRQLNEANTQLQRAKEAAEAASTAKSQFLAVASHELRTPLNAIVGFSELLKDDSGAGLTEEQTDYAEQILASGLQLLTMINSILDLSRLEGQQLSLRAEPFDLRFLLNQVAALSGEQARRKNLGFDLALAPDVPAILVGDPARLRQVITYLTDNALKFTATGWVKLGVERVAEQAQQVTLKFVVSDTGIGMSPEQLSLLFQTFTQGDGSLTRKYGGLGIGLAISQRLVQLFGGELSVTSEPGQGSTFRFTAVFGRGS